MYHQPQYRPARLFSIFLHIILQLPAHLLVNMVFAEHTRRFAPFWYLRLQEVTCAHAAVSRFVTEEGKMSQRSLESGS